MILPEEELELVAIGGAATFAALGPRLRVAVPAREPTEPIRLLVSVRESVAEDERTIRLEVVEDPMKGPPDRPSASRRCRRNRR
jgi:hypothetical protein